MRLGLGAGAMAASAVGAVPAAGTLGPACEVFDSPFPRQRPRVPESVDLPACVDVRSASARPGVSYHISMKN